MDPDGWFVPSQHHKGGVPTLIVRSIIVSCQGSSRAVRQLFTDSMPALVWFVLLALGDKELFWRLAKGEPAGGACDKGGSFHMMARAFEATGYVGRTDVTFLTPTRSPHGRHRLTDPGALDDLPRRSRGTVRPNAICPGPRPWCSFESR
jgi:hypothetical protein